MELVRGKKEILLSVGEFASFRLFPNSPSQYSPSISRLEEGRKLHNSVQNQSSQQNDKIQHEVTIKRDWQHKGWKFRLHGRIDSVHLCEESKTVTITEIKSTSHELPQSIGWISDHYPEYIGQLATYLFLYQNNPVFKDWEIQGVFHWIQTATQKQSSILFEIDPENIVLNLFHKIHPFLENRWERFHKVRTLTISTPYEKWREGQEDALQKLEGSLWQKPITCFEAPTGFGKTGVTSHLAIKNLQAGMIDKVLYLTGKSTGQMEVVRNLFQQTKDQDAIRFLQIRNRTDLRSDLKDYPEDLNYLWQESGLVPYQLFENNTIQQDSLFQVQDNTKIPPYEILKSMLPYAEFWISDYNYVFSPNSQALINDIPNYNPANTLLIIDEAHNLANRVELAFSQLITFWQLEELSSEIGRDELFFPGIKAVLENLLDWFKAQSQYDVLNPIEEKKIKTFLNQTADAFNKQSWLNGSLSLNSQNTIRDLINFHQILIDTEIKTLLSYQEEHTLAIHCYQANNKIYSQLKRFSTSILMSATLSPLQEFLTETGIPKEKINFIHAKASWRDQAYDVAIDTRADTRYRSRSNSIPLTAETILHSIGQSSKRVAVFFPSYDYAHKVLKQIRILNPWANVILQPRTSHLADQTEFLLTEIPNAEAVFLILGSAFSEGIDGLGDLIDLAIIVGPALPEINSLQEAKKQASGSSGFYLTYQIPAMRKINQAIGRLVRKPGHHAKVLLHCYRFTQQEYLDNLPPEYTPKTIIKDERNLIEWLAK